MASGLTRVAGVATTRGVRTRRLISASLLLVQAFVFHHAALSAHVVDSTGLAFEAAALASDSHEGDSHLCADLATVEGEEQACPVLAAVSAAAVLVPPSTPVEAARSLHSLELQAHAAAPPLTQLCLAPKSSPPARA